MKKIAIVLMAAIALVACADKSKEIINNDGRTGTLAVAVQTNTEFTTKAEVMPKLADLEVEIRNASDNSLWRRWDKYGDGIGEINDIKVGNYVISAFSGTLQPAAFEAPYVHGSQGFSINPDETTPVELTSTLKNSKITVLFTDKLKAGVIELEAVVTGVAGGILSYTPTETRAGYFAIPEDGVVTIVVTGRRILNNEPINQKMTLTAFAASQWHKVTVDLVSTIGTGSFEIGINTELVEKDLGIEIPDQDDIIGGVDPDEPEVPQPGNGPTVIGQSFKGSPFDISKPITITGADLENADPELGLALDLLIAATNGVKNLYLTINSPVLPQEMLEGMGLWGEFDMANLESGSKTEETLVGLGLIDPANPIKGKTSHKFSVGAFMSLLSTVGGAGNTHTFSLRVVDNTDLTTSAALVINMTE